MVTARMINSTHSGDWCPWWSQWCFPGVCKVSPKSLKTMDLNPWKIWYLLDMQSCLLVDFSRCAHVISFSQGFQSPLPKKVINLHTAGSLGLPIFASWAFNAKQRYERWRKLQSILKSQDIKSLMLVATHNCGMLKFSAWKHLAFKSLSN